MKRMGLFVLAMALSAVAQDRPNIVMILMDDLGRTDLGCTGSTFYQTPNIDRICAEGMRFSQAYANAPICSPSRGAILFGRYPARTHLTDWIPGRDAPYGKVKTPQHKYYIELGTSSMASELKKAGYVSAFIGKTHICTQKDKKHNVDAFGFDFVYEDWKHNREPAPSDPKGVFTLTDKAIQFMKQNRDKPFFVFLSHYAVHNPVISNPEVVKEYEARANPNAPQHNAEYAAMLNDADRSIGQLLDYMKNAGLEKNTVIVFFSDNGGLLSNTSNAPYRDGKGSTYGGGIRSPCFVRWPAVISPGSKNDTVITGVDWMPTFMDLAGLTEFEDELDGLSIVPLLKGTGTLDRDAVFWHYPHYYQPTHLPSSVIRMGDYKLIYFYGDDRVELYNVTEDIGETTNLAESMPEKVSEMRARLEQWKKSVHAQEPVHNPDYDPARALESVKRSEDAGHSDSAEEPASQSFSLPGVWEQRNKPERCFIFRSDFTGVAAGGSLFHWQEDHGTYHLIWDESGKTGKILIHGENMIKIGKSMYRKRNESK